MIGYVTNIEQETIHNIYFRRVLYTSENQQLVIMNLKPQEDIGGEIHKEVDQFIRIEKGKGLVQIDNYMYELSDGISINIPKGTFHNIINTSLTEPLKLYTIYSPPNHPFNRIDVDKPLND